MGLVSWSKKKVWKTVIQSRLKELMGAESYESLHQKSLQPTFIDAIYEAAWGHYGAEAVERYVAKTGCPYGRETSGTFVKAAVRFIFIYMNSVAVDRHKGVQFTRSKISEYERTAVQIVNEKFGI